jgi:Predicted membrane protein
MPEGAKFCQKCGQSVIEAADQPKSEEPAQNPQIYYQPSQQQPQQRYYEPPHAYQAPQLTPDAEENRYLCMFAYFGIGVLIPAVLKPNSEFVRYHINQGLVLFMLEIISAVVCIVPILGWVAGGVGLIFCLVCIVIGIVHTCNGEMRPLPIIGKHRILR